MFFFVFLDLRCFDYGVYQVALWVVDWLGEDEGVLEGFFYFGGFEEVVEVDVGFDCRFGSCCAGIGWV